MIIKLVGAAVIFGCGALYSSAARREVTRELDETDRVLSLFRYIKSEISDYGTPLDEIFAARGISGGPDGLLSSVSESLRAEISEALALSRVYGNEALRVCDRLMGRLDTRKKLLESRVREVTAISRVKGYGISAAVVILLI